MERVCVGSSSIAAIGYSESTRVLEVEFRNGGVYRYLAVPPAHHAALMKAESKGQYVNRMIKTCFEVVRVGGVRQ